MAGPWAAWSVPCRAQVEMPSVSWCQLNLHVFTRNCEYNKDRIFDKILENVLSSLSPFLAFFLRTIVLVYSVVAGGVSARTRGPSSASRLWNIKNLSDSIFIKFPQSAINRVEEGEKEEIEGAFSLCFLHGFDLKSLNTSPVTKMQSRDRCGNALREYGY